MNVSTWLDQALEPGWVLHDTDLTSPNPLQLPGYQPGSEPVSAASGTCGGLPAEATAFDFSVLGGSMGVVAGEVIARAFERAIKRRAAVIALTASGGARMQEGMPALVQMAKTVVARDALAAAGLPFIAYLRNPTTGGVYASFGSLADLVWAEPRAMIGFAGPRVAATVTGKPLPAGSHTAEFALDHGLIDAIIDPQRLGKSLRHAVRTLLGADEAAPVAPPADAGRATPAGWTSARDPQRPTGAGFARAIVDGIVEIRGDRAGADDGGVVCAVGRLSGRRVAVVALNRTHPTPAGYRKAQRLIALAGRLKLPLVTFIDTPGADPSSESEAAGIAHAIASTFKAVLAHPAPVVAVVTGEGGSGGALALAVADHLLICEGAIFSVIAPEAAAAILRRDDVEGVAKDLKLTSGDLQGFGIADNVIGDSPDAIRHAITQALDGPPPTDSRRTRWRTIG